MHIVHNIVVTCEIDCVVAARRDLWQGLQRLADLCVGADGLLNNAAAGAQDAVAQERNIILCHCPNLVYPMAAIYTGCKHRVTTDDAGREGCIAATAGVHSKRSTHRIPIAAKKVCQVVADTKPLWVHLCRPFWCQLAAGQLHQERGDCVGAQTAARNCECQQQAGKHNQRKVVCTHARDQKTGDVAPRKWAGASWIVGAQFLFVVCCHLPIWILPDTAFARNEAASGAFVSRFDSKGVETRMQHFVYTMLQLARSSRTLREQRGAPEFSEFNSHISIYAYALH